MAIPTRRRVGDVFCMASHRSTMTSPKSLTDKPDNKQTSRKDKQTTWEHVPNPSRQDLLFLWVGIYSRDPESGSISHYITPPPPPVMCHSFHTLKMTGTHQEQPIDHLRVLFIALIYPIQWTNAIPVGADRPAKRQKKTSCVSTGRLVPSTSALARWCVVLPSCIDSVTS